MKPPSAIGIGRSFVAAMVMLLAGTATASAVVRYVDDDATAGGDGLSWATAHKYLQDALTATSAYDEIRVAAGTYQTDRTDAQPNSTGSPTATFRLKSRVAAHCGHGRSGG